jgi:hypothetical protein
MPSRREIVQGLTDRTGTTTWWGDAVWNVQFAWFLFAFAWICWDHQTAGVIVMVAYIAFVALPFQIARHRRWERLGRVDPLIPMRVNVAFGCAALALIVGAAFLLSGLAWVLGSLCIGSLLFLTQTAYARRVLPTRSRPPATA